MLSTRVTIWSTPPMGDDEREDHQRRVGHGMGQKHVTGGCERSQDVPVPRSTQSGAPSPGGQVPADGGWATCLTAGQRGGQPQQRLRRRPPQPVPAVCQQPCVRPCRIKAPLPNGRLPSGAQAQQEHGPDGLGASCWSRPAPKLTTPACASRCDLDIPTNQLRLQ